MPTPASAEDKPKKLASYTVKLDDAQMEKLRGILVERGWTPFEVAYARYAFKADHLKTNLTAYLSGKAVVAGKGTEDFVRDILEPEITQVAKLGYDEVLHPDWFQSHAGLDESGKGDFFGPLVAATVIAGRPAVEAWIKAGVKDSKKLAESQILKFDRMIRETPGVAVKTFVLTMGKYNELMFRKGASVNRLLGWMHATAAEQALAQIPVPWGLLDQFSEQPLVQRELARKKVQNFELRMRTHAEEDPVVAAASVVARAEYVSQMNELSRRLGAKLQKGASSLVKDQALEIINKLGAAALGDFAKLHFRTAYEVVSAAGKLGELPLPEPKARMEWGS